MNNNDFIGSNHYGDFSITDQPRKFWETDPAGIDLDEILCSGNAR